MSKTYKEYLAESKPITRNLAPVGAVPKMSRGDSHRHRNLTKTMSEKKMLPVYQIPVHKNGIIKVKESKRMVGL